MMAMNDHKNPVRRTDYRDPRKTSDLLAELHKMSDVFRNEMRDAVIKAFRKYRADQKKWQDANDKNTNGVIIPFTPEASGAVFLDVFPSAYQRQRQRIRMTEDILNTQRNSPGIRQINDGEVIIKYPDL